jgi:predicted lipoprotein with Yx(FWY)xxD motif
VPWGDERDTMVSWCRRCSRHFPGQLGDEPRPPAQASPDASVGSRAHQRNGHPLYYYVADLKPDETLGEGLNAFGAGWDVVSPAGTKIEKAGG